MTGAIKDIPPPLPGAPGCACLCHQVGGVSHIMACCTPGQTKRTFACCERPTTEGHRADCELRYGTTHLKPLVDGKDAIVPCCRIMVSDLPKGDLSTDTKSEVTCPGENKPLPWTEIWGDRSPYRYEQVGWTVLGEDGEQAIMDGHVDPTLLRDAMAEEGFDLDPGEFSAKHAWGLFTAHLEDCRDGLGPDDSCGCDEYGWFCHIVPEGTEGALPVTYWTA